MGLPQPVRRYTVQEYYELDRAAEFKSEFYGGEIFAMAGGTVDHSRICSNLIGEIRTCLRGKPCEVFESNLRLKIKATGLRTYPDASVYCGPMERDEEDSTGQTFTNPTVVFEVLSPSTEGYDRGFNAENYRQVQSLRAYVLISQRMPHAEIFERQPDDSWLLREVRGREATLNIPSIGVVLPLAEMYARVEFPPAGTWPRGTVAEPDPHGATSK
jgi:Uma2 family endonuclease